MRIYLFTDFIDEYEHVLQAWLEKMQCEVRAMNEANPRSRTVRTSDTLPKPGRVTEGKNL